MIVECIAASTRRFLINSSTNQYFQFEPAHLNGFAAQAKGLPLWLEFDRDHHYGHVIGAWYQGEFLMLRAAIMRMLPPVDYYIVPGFSTRDDGSGVMKPSFSLTLTPSDPALTPVRPLRVRMEPEFRHEVRVIEEDYWTCAIPGCKHTTEAAAENCITKVMKAGTGKKLSPPDYQHARRIIAAREWIKGLSLAKVGDLIGGMTRGRTAAIITKALNLAAEGADGPLPGLPDRGRPMGEDAEGWLRLLDALVVRVNCQRAVDAIMKRSKEGGVSSDK